MTNEDRPAEPGTDLATPDLPAAQPPPEMAADAPPPESGATPEPGSGDPSLATLVAAHDATAPADDAGAAGEAPAAGAPIATGPAPESAPPLPQPPVIPPPAPVLAAPALSAPVQSPAPVVTTAAPARRGRRWPRTLRGILAFLFGILQALLILRILLLFLNANPDNEIVAWILRVTEPFVEPFRGMFSLDEIEGASGSVVDVAAIVALVAWTLVETLVLSLLRLFDRGGSGRR